MMTFTTPAEPTPSACAGVHLDTLSPLDDPSERDGAPGCEEPSAHERYVEELAQVDAAHVPPDADLPVLGIEHLIVRELIDRDHPGMWTRRELEEELHAEAAPDAIAAALGRLRGAGAVVRDGEQVRPSRCVDYLIEIGLVGP